MSENLNEMANHLDYDNRLEELHTERRRLLELEQNLRSQIARADRIIARNRTIITHQAYQLESLRRVQIEQIWKKEDELTRDEVNYVGDAVPIVLVEARQELMAMMRQARANNVLMDDRKESELRGKRVEFIINQVERMMHNLRLDKDEQKEIWNKSKDGDYLRINNQMMELINKGLRREIYEFKNWMVVDESEGYTENILQRAIEKVDMTYEEIIPYVVGNYL